MSPSSAWNFLGSLETLSSPVCPLSPYSQKTAPVTKDIRCSQQPALSSVLVPSYVETEAKQCS